MDYSQTSNISIEGAFLSVEQVDSPSLFATGLNNPEFSVSSALENKVFWFSDMVGVYPEVFRVAGSIDVESPCYMEGTNTLGHGDIVVGQVGKGLTVFEVTPAPDGESFTSSAVSNAGDGRSLCYFMRNTIPENLYTPYPGVRSASVRPLTAIDIDTNELVFYGDSDGDDVLEELGSTPLMTNSSNQLQIADVIVDNTDSLPFYFLVLLTDGVDGGEHRLVTASFDLSTSELVQEVYEWSGAVPVAMTQGNFGGATLGPDLIIVLGTSEQSLYFDDLQPAPYNFALPPVYGEPALIDVASGGSSAVTAMRPDGPETGIPNHVLMVSYPDSGEVRVYQLQ